MTDQLISFETAKLAKEKGIHEISPYLYRYNDEIFPSADKSKRESYLYLDINLNNIHKYEDDDILVPTQSLLQKWLREVHKVIVSPFISWNLITWGYNIHFVNVKDVYEEASKRVYHGANYKSYEEALEFGLQEALKLIKI